MKMDSAMTPDSTSNDSMKMGTDTAKKDTLSKTTVKTTVEKKTAKKKE